MCTLGTFGEIILFLHIENAKFNCTKWPETLCHLIQVNYLMLVTPRVQLKTTNSLIAWLLSESDHLLLLLRQLWFWFKTDASFFVTQLWQLWNLVVLVLLWKGIWGRRDKKGDRTVRAERGGIGEKMIKVGGVMDWNLKRQPGLF